MSSRRSADIPCVCSARGPNQHQGPKCSGSRLARARQHCATSARQDHILSRVASQISRRRCLTIEVAYFRRYDDTSDCRAKRGETAPWRESLKGGATRRQYSVEQKPCAKDGRVRGR